MAVFERFLAELEGRVHDLKPLEISSLCWTFAATGKASQKLLDDMQRNHQTRRAFDEVVASGKLATPTCQEKVNIAVSHIHRRDTTSVKTLSMDWCTAKVI